MKKSVKVAFIFLMVVFAVYFAVRVHQGLQVRNTIEYCESQGASGYMITGNDVHCLYE